MWRAHRRPAARLLSRLTLPGGLTSSIGRRQGKDGAASTDSVPSSAWGPSSTRLGAARRSPVPRLMASCGRRSRGGRIPSDRRAGPLAHPRLGAIVRVVRFAYAQQDRAQDRLRFPPPPRRAPATRRTRPRVRQPLLELGGRPRPVHARLGIEPWGWGPKLTRAFRLAASDPTDDSVKKALREFAEERT